jgi:hypothetical protein
MGPDKWVDAFNKLNVKILVSVIAICAFLLFAPDAWLSALHLTPWLQPWQGWVGGTFVVASAILGVQILGGAYAIATSFYFRRTIRGKILKKLRSLSLEEKVILASFYFHGTASRDFEASDGVIRELERHYILISTAPVLIFSGQTSYAIDDLARDYLNKNQHVLMPTEEEQLSADFQFAQRSYIY